MKPAGPIFGDLNLAQAPFVHRAAERARRARRNAFVKNVLAEIEKLPITDTIEARPYRQPMICLGRSALPKTSTL